MEEGREPKPVEESAARPESTAGGPGWLRTTAQVFYSPRQCFATIRGSGPWIGAWLLSSGLGIVTSFGLKAVRSAFDLGREASDGILPDWAANVATVILAPFGALSSVLTGAGVLWVVTLAFRGRPRFRPALSLSAHLTLVSSVAGVTLAAVALVLGLLAVSGSADPGLLDAVRVWNPDAVGALLPSATVLVGGALLLALLLIGWFAALTTLGVSAVFGFPLKWALAVTLTTFAIGALFNWAEDVAELLF